MSQLVDFKQEYAAIWRAKKEYLKPVKNIDTIDFDTLVGIERQKSAIIKIPNASWKGYLQIMSCFGVPEEQGNHHSSKHS